MTQTLEETREGTSCYIEIRLEDGERIHARVSGDEAAARAELASFHAKLDSQAYVLVGDDTIVRSEDVRYVQLTDSDASGGILDTVKDKFRGGNMSNYETQQGGGSATKDREGGPGITDQWIGYGNRPWAETKPFFLTSEFLAAAALIAGILVATGMNDNLDAPRGWLYTAIVGAAYILSRGIAKAGTRDPNPDRSGYGGGWSRQ